MTESTMRQPTGLILVGPETELTKSFNSIQRQLRNSVSSLTVLRLPKDKVSAIEDFEPAFVSQPGPKGPKSNKQHKEDNTATIVKNCL